MFLCCSSSSLSCELLCVFRMFENMFYCLFKEDGILTSFEKDKKLVVCIALQHLSELSAEFVEVYMMDYGIHIHSDLTSLIESILSCRFA